MQTILFRSRVSLFSFFLSLTVYGHAQTFTKITTGPVVNSAGDSRSVNWIDFNNDGYLDLMITNSLVAGQDNALYINDGAGGFTAITGSPVVMDGKPSDGATWADTDNDGDLDCFVVNWHNADNMFYINNAGSFIQDTISIIGLDTGYSETASWGDYDNDGLVDLYVANSGGNRRNYLYHNNGGNTFTKITNGAMVTEQYASRCVNWTDIDSDGDLDLFVANEANQAENIYRNDTGGIFTKLTGGPLLANGGQTMSSSWADYDNDGDMDVFLANDLGNNALFRNDGNFTFVKITGDTVSNSAANSFSSAWSDIDNDGDVDLFVTNCFHGTSLHLNFLYLNNGNGSFTRVNNTIPATDMDWSYGCAFGDYDNDGFEDLAVATAQFNNIDRTDLLYHNDGNANAWITIKLTGVAVDGMAIGTKVRLKAMINGTQVWQMRELSAQSSYCGQNDIRAHFGLGNASVIDSIIVEWLSGLTETYTNVAVNQFMSLTEGQTTGLQIINGEDKLNVFPNPSPGNISIELTKGGFKSGDKIEVINIKGQVLYEYLVNSEMKTVTIDTSSFAGSIKGNYFIKVISGSGELIKKIVKQ